MANNFHMGQLVGPFAAGENLFNKIVENANIPMTWVSHLGIQAEVGQIVYINNEPYEIGKTGIYEVTNVEINSIYFENDVDHHTIIDYTIIR